MEMALLKYMVAGVLLSLFVFSNLVQAASNFPLPESELAALQDLRDAWSQTKDFNSTLPGWVSFDPANTTDDPCLMNAWRGVYCTILGCDNTTCLSVVVSLEVSDASIVGTLPSSVWNFSNLVSLALTGNPELTGPLPPLPQLDSNGTVDFPLFLRSLDLHGNALDGDIPDSMFNPYVRMEELDLSNNRLNGPLPSSFGFLYFLRTLKLSNNSLTGNIPANSLTGNVLDNISYSLITADDAVVNPNSSYLITYMITWDFSSNKFTGNIPNVSAASFLHTLNISHNNFEGPVNISALSPLANTTLAILDLSDNWITGPMPDLSYWNNLQSLDLSNNKFDAGAFPPWLSSLQNLQTLGLGNTSLIGEHNLTMLCHLKQLSTVELNNNNLTGTLDIDSLMGCNGSLGSLNLENNLIGKVKFSGLSVLNLPISFKLTGNPYCNFEKSDIQKCLCGQGCSNTDSRRLSLAVIIGSAVAGSLGAIMMIFAAILFWKNRRDKEYLMLTLHQKFAEYEMKPTLFSYSELEKATRNFHPDMKLGEGAFGAVYQGKLIDGSEVAVKQLLTKAQQNMDDFLNEVVLLTSVKHRNLVKLKGCCLRGDRRLLVYEYLDNYDLAETLFDHKGNQLVTWPTRFKLCLGVAQGLHYLHDGVEPRILHRDIKASNILLDQNLHPKIADFGLAMLFPNEESHITITQIAGTRGYLAPEYATRGQLSDKVDVYSFGVLALEIVSGRKNISFDVPPSQTYLIDWAWKLNEEGTLMDLLDSTMSIPYDEEVVALRVINTALKCLQTSAERRPTMAQVVKMLQGDIEISTSVRGRMNEDVNQTYYSLLRLNNSLTIVDEESQALQLGMSSHSENCSPIALELTTIRGR